MVTWTPCKVEESCAVQRLDGSMVIYSRSMTCGLFYHELYHALHGALGGEAIVDQVSFRSNHGLEVDLAEELAADDYAASKVGAETLKKELLEVFQRLTATDVLTLTGLMSRIERLS